jgi:hypothetical protein
MSDTQDGVPRYIGQTDGDPERRLNKHLAKAIEKDEKTPLHKWIRDVLRSGYMVDVHVIQKDIAQKELDLFERYWMRQFQNLLNTIFFGPRSTEATPLAAQVIQALRQKVMTQKSS